MNFRDCGIYGAILAVILGMLSVAFVGQDIMLEVADDTLVEPSTGVIIENVATRGGLEVFPEPNRTSGRIFAASANFAPHVAGINANEDWLFLLYLDNGVVVAGWSPRSQIVLTNEEVVSLTVINIQNMPTLPTELTGDLVAASRPYGVNAGSTPAPTDSGDGNPAPTNTPSGGGGNPPPTSPPPPTNTPGPIVTEEPTDL